MALGRLATPCRGRRELVLVQRILRGMHLSKSGCEVVATKRLCSLVHSIEESRWRPPHNIALQPTARAGGINKGCFGRGTWSTQPISRQVAGAPRLKAHR